MEKFLDIIHRYTNLIVGVLISMLGVFSVSLIMSADWGTVAQSLGNIIGAAIGALGAAAAVVWQMRKHELRRSTELRELRQASFQAVENGLVILARNFRESSKALEAGDFRKAIDIVLTGHLPTLLIDPNYQDMLRARAPNDPIIFDNMNYRYKRTIEALEKIKQTPTNDLRDKEDTCGAVRNLANAVIEYISAMQDSFEFAEHIERLFKETLDRTKNIQGDEFMAKMRWMFR